MNNERSRSVLSFLKTDLFSSFLLLLTLVALGHAVWGFPALLERLLCPYQVAQTEAEIVEHSLQVLRGGSFWAPKTYLLPPLSFPFYLLQTFLLKCFGGIWWAGRSISFASYLGIFVLLVLFGKDRWGWSWSALFGGVFLLSPTWAFWATVTRVDVFMLFWNFLCLFLISKKISEVKVNSGQVTWLLLAAFCNAMAIVNKPTGIVVTAAVCANFLLQREWRKLFTFSGAVALLVLGTHLWVDLLTEGAWFHKSFGAVTGYHWDLALAFFLVHFLPEAGWLMVAGLAALFLGRAPLLWKCQFCFSLVGLLGLGNLDGAENYYLDLILFGIVLLGESVGSKGVPEKDLKRSLWLRRLVLGALIVGIAQMILLPWPTAPSAEVCQMKTEAASIYRMPGEHFAVDDDLLVMAGKTVWFQVHGMRNRMESGQEDTAPLLRMIREHTFATIEIYDLPQQPFLPAIVEAEIEKDYTPRIKRFGRVWMFPKTGK